MIQRSCIEAELETLSLRHASGLLIRSFYCVQIGLLCGKEVILD